MVRQGSQATAGPCGAQLWRSVVLGWVAERGEFHIRMGCQGELAERLAHLHGDYAVLTSASSLGSVRGAGCRRAVPLFFLSLALVSCGRSAGSDVSAAAADSPQESVVDYQEPSTSSVPMGSPPTFTRGDLSPEAALVEGRWRLSGADSSPVLDDGGEPRDLVMHAAFGYLASQLIDGSCAPTASGYLAVTETELLYVDPPDIPGFGVAGNPCPPGQAELPPVLPELPGCLQAGCPYKLVDGAIEFHLANGATYVFQRCDEKSCTA